MNTSTSPKTSRADNRLAAILDVAAKLFGERGYSATSMRDIADAVGMLPGSLYYYFPGKEALLAAVYETGVRGITEAVRRAVLRESEPWARLEAACVAHLQTVLQKSDYAQVLIRVLPEDVPPVAPRLAALREEYEALFRELVTALPVPAGADRRALRLMLIGALNWSRFWYRANGRDSPRQIARRFVRLLRDSQDAGEKRTP